MTSLIGLFGQACACTPMLTTSAAAAANIERTDFVFTDNPSLGKQACTPGHLGIGCGAGASGTFQRRASMRPG